MGNIRTRSLAGKIAEMSSVRSDRGVLVTGATGLLGSHLAEKLIAQGYLVRALVRQSGDTGFLKGLGVEIERGDLTDPTICDRAVRDVSLVFHCAAKVGDWGSWKEFQVGGARGHAHACRGGRTRRGRAVRAHQLDKRLRSSAGSNNPDRRDGSAGTECLGPGSLHPQQDRVRAAALGHGRFRPPSLSR